MWLRLSEKSWGLIGIVTLLGLYAVLTIREC